MLKFDEPSRRRLSAHMADAAGRAGLIVCTVAQILDLVAYAIAEYPPASLDRVVARGWAILADLRDLA